ncbi:hypothetical protein J53TS2_35430 [Paenibacillus sp. J53TS2]|nr:hypothetical protein J53TS2_35430 [Paenibacillus sp. J53TS2]
MRCIITITLGIEIEALRFSGKRTPSLFLAGFPSVSSKRAGLLAFGSLLTPSRSLRIKPQWHKGQTNGWAFKTIR